MFEFYDLGLKTWEEDRIPLTLNAAGSPGSICSHWSEFSFNTTVNSELMTPFFRTGVANPLSTVTVGALEDLGYEVDYSKADGFPKEALVEGHRRRRNLQSASFGPVPDHDFNLAELMMDVDLSYGVFTAYEY